MIPSIRKVAGLLVGWTIGACLVSPACGGRTPPVAGVSSSLSSEILADDDLKAVLTQARQLLRTGLNAGAGYDEVWIRDLNTFVDLALEVNDAAVVRDALETLIQFQGPAGDIPDGIVRREGTEAGRLERRSTLAPGWLAQKNTVETDQESSLVQAVRKYVDATSDRAFLDQRIAGTPVIDRLGQALEYVMSERFDASRGLAWGATTADWGDVQPETEFGVEFDSSSHRAIDVYDNAMLAIAIDDYRTLLPARSPKQAVWERRHSDLVRNIRAHLWDATRQKFIPHVYLDGSPFPRDFDEAAIYYHGGTAVAIEAGLLTQDEIVAALATMRDDVRKAHAGSIGLSLYPPYPAGLFKKSSMAPYDYQNGGDWCWFGGRMVQQLIKHGLVRDAYTELRPMVARVRKYGDFYEFWSRDNEPRGSAEFRGSAGVLGKAIEQIIAWARDERLRELSRR